MPIAFSYSECNMDAMKPCACIDGTCPNFDRLCAMSACALVQSPQGQAMLLSRRFPGSSIDQPERAFRSSCSARGWCAGSVGRREAAAGFRYAGRRSVAESWAPRVAGNAIAKRKAVYAKREIIDLNIENNFRFVSNRRQLMIN